MPPSLDNLAIKGVAHFYNKKGKHIITSKIEHKAVLDPCRQLEREGFEVTYLEPDSNGIISPRQVSEALRDDTILVSLMHVNNEIGTITDIAAIGEITREKGVLFHVDAAQSAGKLPINLNELKVDLLSVCATQDLWPQGCWCSLCTPQAACTHRSTDSWRWSRAWHAFRYLADPSDCRDG